MKILKLSPDPGYQIRDLMTERLRLYLMTTDTTAYLVACYLWGREKATKKAKGQKIPGMNGFWDNEA